MGVVPVPFARAVAWVAGWFAWAAMGPRRRALMESMAIIVPEKSEAQRRRIARRTFRNMAGCAVDQFRLPTITPGKLLNLFEIHGIEHLQAARECGRGTVVVSGHIGPYELAAGCVAAAGYKVSTIVENLAPEVLEALASYRAATGMGLINMRDGLREAYQVLERNEYLLLAADRAIGRARSAIAMPFAGGRRYLPTGPATFAMATGAPIIIGFVYRNRKRGPRYRIDFDPPILPQGNDEHERDRLTRLIADRIGGFVRAHPDEWFVFQPKWITDAA